MFLLVVSRDSDDAKTSYRDGQEVRRFASFPIRVTGRGTFSSDKMVDSDAYNLDELPPTSYCL